MDLTSPIPPPSLAPRVPTLSPSPTSTCPTRTYLSGWPTETTELRVSWGPGTRSWAAWRWRSRSTPGRTITVPRTVLLGGGRGGGDWFTQYVSIISILEPICDDVFYSSVFTDLFVSIFEDAGSAQGKGGQWVYTLISVNWFISN